MLGKLFNRGNSHQEFWQWFLQHQAELRQIKTGTEPVVASLAKELRKVHKGLVWQCGGKDETEFCVSADGVRELFPVVQALVAEAPTVPGWKIVAFRQPTPGVGVQMGDRKLDGDSIFYTAQQNGDKLDVVLYVDGMTGPQDDPLTQMCFLLLDATVGEYDVETKIGHIDFRPLIAADGKQRPLKDLPSELAGLA